MAMTTREFIQHLVLNCELDDPVYIEVLIDEDVASKCMRFPGYQTFEPAHASRLPGDPPETLIECKPWKEQ